MRRGGEGGRVVGGKWSERESGSGRSGRRRETSDEVDRSWSVLSGLVEGERAKGKSENGRPGM